MEASAAMIENNIADMIEKAVTEADGKRKLTCGNALKISKEHGIELKAIGQYCDEKGIKIRQCELGCF